MSNQLGAPITARASNERIASTGAQHIRHESLNDLWQRLESLPGLGKNDIDAIDSDTQRGGTNVGGLDLHHQRVDKHARHSKVWHAQRLLHHLLANLCIAHSSSNNAHARTYIVRSFVRKENKVGLQ
jgi:hypothetical protein